MPYERKQRKFSSRGMNWTRPIDSIPDDQFRYLLNVRQYEDGALWSRPGLSQVANSIPTGADPYIHSISTLQDYNPDTGGGAARFVGCDTGLYWQDGLALSAVTLGLVSGSWSGDPQSHIVHTPVGSPVPFTYVFDSTKQRKYAPEYQTTPGTPDEFNIGIPSAYVQYSPAPSGGGAGNLDGEYYWRYVLRDKFRGIVSAPGPASKPLTVTAQSVSFTTPNPAGVTSDYLYDIYRFGGNVQSWRLVGSVPKNTSFTDNLADDDIVAAQTLLTDTADIKFQPWLTPDIDRQGTVTVGAASSTDGSVLTSTAGDTFNTNWILGTQIVVAGIACTIRRIQSTGTLYLEEDIGALGAGKSWSTTGALQSGTPLGRVWGPYGGGQSGLTLFACGDPRAPGTFYWTNGNDPDTTSQVNSLELSSPSEPLQNGCVWNGRAYIWSTDRMWEISPDLSTPGQFTAQLIPGAKGLFAPWGFAVGDQIYWTGRDGIWAYSGGIPKSMTDDALYPFFGHDSLNGFTITIPNPENFASPITHSSPDPLEVRTWRLCWVDGLLYFDYKEYGTSDSKTLICDTRNMQGGWSMDIYMNTGRKSRHYESGMSPAAGSSPLQNLLVGVGATLYYMSGSSDAGSDIPCSIMSGADILGDNRAPKVGGDAVFGAVTNAATITARLLTDNNTAQAVTSTLAPSGAYTQTRINISDKDNLRSSRTWGYWLHWADDGTVRALDAEISYLPRPEVIGKRPTDWTDDGEPGSKYLMSVIIDAEVGTKDTGTDLVVDATDPLKVSSGTYNFVSADVGSALQIVGGSGWKQDTYIIESVASNAAILDHSPAAVGASSGSYVLSNQRTVEVQFDAGSTATTLKLAGPGRYELAYSINPPTVGRQFRLAPSDTNTCQLYGVRYIWEKYPDYLKLEEDYHIDRWPSGKYIRGVAIEGDTQSRAVSLNVLADGATVGSPLSLNQNGKSLSTFAFATPFVANEIKLVPLGRWRKFSVRWIYDEYPDYAALITPWEDGGHQLPKYIRGGRVRLDTADQSINATLWADGATTSITKTFRANGQQTIDFALNPPIVAKQYRWVPNNPWRYFNTFLDADLYPGLIDQRTPVLTPGGPGAKYIREMLLTADTDGVSRTFDLLYDGPLVGPTLASSAFTGKSTKPFAFTPFVAHNVQIVPSGNARIFPDDCQFIYDPYPELTTKLSAVMSPGNGHAVFVQGCRITADSNNTPVSFAISYDGAQVGPTLPATAYRGKQTIPYSFNPFIAHNLQLTPNAPVRLFESEIEWIWEPAPELALVWETQQTNHDIPGWHSLVDGWIAYQSASTLDTCTLTITTEYDVQSYTLPANTTYARTYLRFRPQKARWRKYRISSALGVRLFVKDTAVRISPWGMGKDQSLISAQPFGDLSREMGAKI